MSIHNAASFLLSQIATVAYATTTTRADPTASLSTSTITSTPVSVLPSSAIPNPDSAQSDTPPDAPQVPDVPACSILGVSCHTLTLGGFSADGALIDKPFKGVALNLSFGALVRDGGNGGKLSVRYFHAGGWHSAGDISISSVISNATNGGYFSEKLDGLSSWKDLSDVQVVVEYVAGDGSDAVSVYLDSIWLDAIYTDKIQDVLSGHVANPSDAPDNVTFTLANGDTPQNSLVLSDGSKITFPYLDSLHDTLMVRTDRAVYGPTGTSTTVFTSITNSGSSADTFSLVASFPGAVGTIRDISQYLQDVPSASSSVQTGDVTYYCDSLWQQSTSTSKYSCPSTGEIYACRSLNDSSTNCLVPDVSITTSTRCVCWTPASYGQRHGFNAAARHRAGCPAKLLRRPQG